MIIYNVTESNATTPEERWPEDQQLCLETFNKILNIHIVTGDIKKLFRLGKRDSQSDKGRPLLIQFRDRILKNMIMESLSRLKDADEKFNKLIFAHDLTKNEREECKNLVAEAKVKELQDPSGEHIYRVRGAPGSYRIVKIRKH